MYLKSNEFMPYKNDHHSHYTCQRTPPEKQLHMNFKAKLTPYVSTKGSVNLYITREGSRGPFSSQLLPSLQQPSPN